ncbi:uncharacterized protein EV154DRAFT_136345 [Mucor mucedo]|uniref:uncharacterized protein n=1 Tax=Mucor mucedo TaxID=29922 RepID=UPI00221F411F|nr:uncharacterized protein EV154DRAFT_136345 [Mucor mucedo]KAI7868369.1 hypothetical protein EV154DRAFT_136345 [Mucor mucedo]
MDDLLDLNWSSPTSSSVRPSAPKPQKPRDAFADLLNTTPKPVDTSKLSLAEQQRMQQSNGTHSPWLTPTQAPATLASASRSSTPGYSTTPPPATAVYSNSDLTQSSNKASFENLLSPFSGNSTKTQSDRNTPLNQLRNQTNSASTSGNSSQWDLDLLDSKFNTSTTTAQTLDPFDMDSLVQEAKQFSNSPQPSSLYEEDDNPLGILAQPAQPTRVELSPELLPVPALPASPVRYTDASILDDDEEDRMIIQLIDMGFSLQESKFAIEATGRSNLQSAVDLLIQNSEAVQRQQPTRAPPTSQEKLTETERARMNLFGQEIIETPRQQKERKVSRAVEGETGEGEAQFQTEKIVMQAQEFGGFLYKNASSFLKTGRQKVTKAVGDWQEQQRAQRLQQMQEEQGGPIRPKWMTEGEGVEIPTSQVEKFADDDDSDREVEEEDLEAERRKLQELRRQQELKQREKAAAAHKARQQQNLRKETLIKEEEVYVSPSRRRGNTPSSSGRSTPRSVASQQQQQQQQQQPASSQKPPVVATPEKNKRTRPVVNASSDTMTKVNEARNQGNEKFKLGQFGDAEEAYTRAIEILPAGHDHQVLLFNNRAMARLKTGHYKQCVEDCDAAIALSKQSGDGSSISEGVTIQWRDQMIKSLYRKAEALENIEKYKDALATYDDLVKLEGTGNPKVNQGMSRCRQALNPRKATPQPRKTTSPTQKPKEDFMTMFDPSSTSSPPAVSAASAEELNKSKAVTAMRAKAAEQEAQDAEKLERTDDVNARLLAWKAGKEQNLRALLATLDTLLWPGAQWKGAQMSELINPKKCKMIYMRAIGKVHPDKLPSNVTVEQKMLASGIFAVLNEAWDSFKGQNNL